MHATLQPARSLTLDYEGRSIEPLSAPDVLELAAWGLGVGEIAYVGHVDETFAQAWLASLVGAKERGP